jgi:hypothetical protein
MRTPFNSPNFSKGQLVVRADFVKAWDPNGWSRLGWRRATQEEIKRWYESPDSKGMDDTGETKLPPRDVSVKLIEDRVYEVVRGRVSAPRGYDKVPACMEIQCYTTGERFFVKREWFRLV